MTGKYLLATLGCKVNQYESEQIREVLESFGLTRAETAADATVAVINTCAVTASASRKNRQTIRRAARGGRTPVFVVGCGATADADRLGKLEGVAAVLGHDRDVCAELRKLLSDQLNHKANERPRHTRRATEPSQTRPNVRGNEVSIMPPAVDSTQGVQTLRNPPKSLNIIPPPITGVKKSTDLVDRIDTFANHQRAFLKVQDGCDAFCTYCIIPQLRPTLRSKPIAVAVQEATALVRAGHQEIILTGIFLGAYLRETALRKRWSTGRSPLADLVDALAGVDGLKRLRLSSLEPGDVDSSLLDVLAKRDNCVPHLHLPLQSGSGDILRRMNRQYTVDAFVEMIDNVRAVLDRPAISTDIIVGFPGEMEEDFEASLQIAQHTEFCKIHAFPFSPREHTAAARWQAEFVRPEVARERMGRLADLERELSLSFRQRFIGDVERVIVEQDSRKQRTATSSPAVSNATTNTNRHADANTNSDVASTTHHGRSDRYFEIHFDAPDEPTSKHGIRDDVAPGQLVSVRIDRVTLTRTHGTIVHHAPRRHALPVLTG